MPTIRTIKRLPMTDKMKSFMDELSALAAKYGADGRSSRDGIVVEIDGETNLICGFDDTDRSITEQTVREEHYETIQDMRSNG